MKKFITIGMIFMFALVAVNAEPLSEEQFVTKLEKSGVQFVYSTNPLYNVLLSGRTNSRVTLIKTESTAETVDALVAEKPDSVDITVVKYINHGRAGYELNYGHHGVDTDDTINECNTVIMTPDGEHCGPSDIQDMSDES